MFFKIVKSSLLVASITLLTACGGGGGSSDSSDDNKDNGRSNLADTQDSGREDNSSVKDPDKIAPTITVLGKNPITVIQNSTYKDAGATAKDNVDGVVKVKSSGSVNTSVIKSYTIIYTATDKAGNKATEKRVVTVIKKATVADTIAPTITILGKNPLSIVQNSTYKDAGATAKDNVDGVVKVKSSGSVKTSILGKYAVIYIATDKAGNKATKTRTVNVTLAPDKTPPLITIIGDNPLEIAQGKTFSDPGATAKDDRDGVVVVTSSGKVDMSIVGSYTIIYSAQDKTGNKIIASRVVKVKSADVVWNVSSVSEFRQALEDASANGESDRIILAKGVYKTTDDGLGKFTFDDNEEFNLTIESEKGLTQKDVILDGNNTNQVFNFNNSKNSTLSFKRVSIINGKSATKGGGVYSNKNIDINKCNISKNTTSSDGGGLYGINLTIKNSTISNNISISNYYRSGGGGFYATATSILNSIISKNKAKNGGGFYVSSSIIKTSSIFNNSASSEGGGFIGGNTNIEKSTISNNSSGDSGGGFSSASATINSSTILKNSAKNDGGGFYSSGTLTLTNSMFLDNNSSTGAIFHNSSYYSFAYVSNNSFIGNIGSIHSEGIFINNIFSSNDADITLSGDSKIYNNYIDYTKINDGGYNVIKKSNLQPASVGEIYFDSDNKKLTEDSPVLDKGLNPSSITYKKIIGGEKRVYNSEIREYELSSPQYNKMVNLLKDDMLGKNRIHNGTIDMGAVEYGSTK